MVMNRAERRRQDKAFEKEARKHGPDEPRYVCPFPGCGRPFYKEEDRTNACDYHRQFISDFFFAALNFKPREVQPGAKGEKKGPVLLVPKPGMERQAIEEAMKGRGKRP